MTMFWSDNNNLHMTVKTCDWVLMSFSSEFIALQDMILFRSFGLTKTLILERVTHPPEGLVTVFVVWISVGNVLLSTNHWIVAGGFEFSVMHSKLRLSPTRASDGPISRTLAGATEIENYEIIIKILFIDSSIEKTMSNFEFDNSLSNT